MALVESIIKKDKRGRRQVYVPVSSTVHDIAKVVFLNRMLFLMMPAIFTPDTYEQVDSVLNQFREKGIQEVVISQDGNFVYFSDSSYHEAIHQSPYVWVFNGKLKAFELMSNLDSNQLQA